MFLKIKKTGTSTDFFYITSLIFWAIPCFRKACFSFDVTFLTSVSRRGRGIVPAGGGLLPLPELLFVIMILVIFPVTFVTSWIISYIQQNRRLNGMSFFNSGNCDYDD